MLTGIVVLIAVAGIGIGILFANIRSSNSIRVGRLPAATTPLELATTPLELEQPSFSALARLAPGGLDESSPVSPTSQAPMLCGGSTPSRLTGSTVVALPGNLTKISVLRFAFSSADAAHTYIQSVLPPSLDHTGCAVPVADSGTFKPVSYIPTDHGIYAASGTTSFSSGPYAHTYVWSVSSYVPEAANVYIVRIDTINGYADQTFMDTVLNAMESPGAPTLTFGGHSLHPSNVRAILQHAPYSGAAQTQGLVPPSAVAGAAYFDCPEVIIGTTPYNLMLENELPNVQAGGLVVATANGSTATIPWGDPVNLRVDLYSTASSETTAPCGSSEVNVNPNYANVLSMTPAD